MKLKTWMKSALAVGALMSLSTGVFADGMLRYATVGEPPSLDQQVITSDLATTIAHHMFEGLYTFNGSSAPVPLLASGETVSEDGKTIVISLRKGVQFHNGQAMTSADVLASLQRWGEFGSRGSLIFDHVESVEATGDFEITLKLKEPFGPWKNLMAFINGGPAIYPASVLEGATKEPISPENYIGTGPYKFNAWEANRYVELVRFDDYASLPAWRMDMVANALLILTPCALSRSLTSVRVSQVCALVIMTMLRAFPAICLPNWTLTLV